MKLTKELVDKVRDDVMAVLLAAKESMKTEKRGCAVAEFWAFEAPEDKCLECATASVTIGGALRIFEAWTLDGNDLAEALMLRIQQWLLDMVTAEPVDLAVFECGQ